MATFKRVTVNGDAHQQLRLGEHEVLMSFLDDLGAEAFLDWWDINGSEAFYDFCDHFGEYKSLIRES